MIFTFQDTVEALSKKLNIPEAIITSVLRHEAEWIQEKMKEGKHPAIFVQGLGTFYSKETRLKKAVEALEAKENLTPGQIKKLEFYKELLATTISYNKKRERKKL